MINSLLLLDLPQNILLADFDIKMFIMEVLLFVVSLWLIFLVLIQRGKGGGLTGALGGSGGSSAFGAKAGDAFTKVTIVSAAIWIFLCMLTIAWVNPPPKPDASAANNGAVMESAEGDSEGDSEGDAEGDAEGDDSIEGGAGAMSTSGAGGSSSATEDAGSGADTSAAESDSDTSNDFVPSSGTSGGDSTDTAPSTDVVPETGDE